MNLCSPDEKDKSWENLSKTAETVKPKDDFLPPPVRYSLLEKIGEGGMGEVWKAEEYPLKRMVALKKNKNNNSARFLREARILAGLSHSNIMPVYDFGKIGNHDYYTMKLITGNSLRKALHDSEIQNRKTTDKLHRFLPIFLSVCRALESAHEKGIIHRDLKPANIMLEGENDVLVCDWGLAKNLQESLEERNAEEGQEENGITQSGQCLGTPLYAPPEQLQSKTADIDRQSDVYSLGVILYEILFGTCPYLGKTPKEIFSRIREGSPLRKGKEVPKELEAIALKAIQDKKASRYASVKKLREDIEDYLSHRPISALQENPFRRLKKWIYRHPVYSLVILLVMVLLYGFYTNYQWKFSTRYNQWMEILLTAKRRADAGVRHQETIRALLSPILDLPYPFFQREIGKIFYSIDQPKEALKYYTRACALTPNWTKDRLLWVYRYELFLWHQSFKEANPAEFTKEEFQEAMKDDIVTQAIQYRDNMTWEEWSHPEKIKKCIDLLTSAQEIYPEFSILYYYLGHHYHRLWNLSQYQNFSWRDQALLDYTKAIALAPHNSDIYFNRHFLYANLKQYAEAEQDLQMAIRHYPFPEGYHYYPYLVRILWYLGRYHEGLEYFKTVEERFSTHTAVDCVETLVSLYEQRSAIYKKHPEVFPDGYNPQEEDKKILFQKTRLASLKK